MKHKCNILKQNLNFLKQECYVLQLLFVEIDVVKINY